MKTTSYFQRLADVLKRFDYGFAKVKDYDDVQAEELFFDEVNIDDVDEYCEIEFISQQQCQAMMNQKPLGSPRLFSRKEFLNLLPTNGYIH